MTVKTKPQTHAPPLTAGAAAVIMFFVSQLHAYQTLPANIQAAVTTGVVLLATYGAGFLTGHYTISKRDSTATPQTLQYALRRGTFVQPEVGLPEGFIPPSASLTPADYDDGGGRRGLDSMSGVPPPVPAAGPIHNDAEEEQRIAKLVETDLASKAAAAPPEATNPQGGGVGANE